MQITNQQWSLIWLFVKQELVYQHKRELLGRLWLFIQPMFYIFIFMTIFSQLMGAKLALVTNIALPEHYSYSIYLVSGLLAWQFFANSVNALSGVYQQKAGLIRKIPISLTWFPIYIPFVELVSYLLAMFVFTIYLAFLLQFPTLSHFLLIPLLLLLFVFTYSLGIIFALLTVFVPDVKRMVSLLLQLFFWATPIVYVVDILPNWAKSLIDFNPIYWILSSIQAIYLCQPIKIDHVVSFLVLTVLLVLMAAWLMRQLKSDIRDLI